MDIATPFLRRPWQGRIRTAVLAAFLANPAAALAPAAETGACWTRNAAPATVAVVEHNGELLLDDGRRAALSGVEFPPAGGAAHKRLSQWWRGRTSSFAPSACLIAGRMPAAFFAAQGSDAAAPIISVGAALLEEGLARFRPDPPRPALRISRRRGDSTGRAAGDLGRRRNAARLSRGGRAFAPATQGAWWFWRAK